MISDPALIPAQVFTGSIVIPRQNYYTDAVLADFIHRFVDVSVVQVNSIV
jgi:hypothetical protein